MNDVIDELNQYWQLFVLGNMSRKGFEAFLSGEEGYIKIVYSGAEDTWDEAASLKKPAVFVVTLF